MLPLSIAIIAKNEEQSLQRLLPVVCALAKQVVVVADSASTDATVKVCRDYGVMVVEEPWRGSIEQKNRAIDLCTEEWIWSLDADEVPDHQLLASVQAFISTTNAGAARVQRRTVYLGKKLRYAWQPDVHLRLVHRSLQPRFVNHNGHDKMQCSAQQALLLRGWLDHYSFSSIAHHFEKTVYYARLGADDYYARGRRAGVLNLIVNPAVAWLKMSVMRGALLDGFPGVLAGLSAWLHVFLKYAMLIQKQRGEHRS
jgi:glycosyltransferase involved in cell wall biosynthesis